jgi:choline transport protein
MNAVQNAFLPILEIFYQMTGSKAVATLLQACLAGLYFCRLSFLSFFLPLSLWLRA